MFRASREFVILSLDGSRKLNDRLDEDRAVTLASQLDHYCARPSTPQFEALTLFHFVQRYKIPKRVGDEVVCTRKEVVVISRPYCSPDPSGPKYEQYCRQQLMMHQPVRQLKELLGTCDNHATAYSIFLQSVISPQSFADDIHQQEVMERENHINNNEEEVSPIFTFTLILSMFCMHIHYNLQDVDQEQSYSDPLTTVQDWMLICQHKTEFPDSNIADRQVDWSHVAKAYSNLKDMPQFIAQPSQHHLPQPAVDSERLQGKQLEAYRLVKDHFESKATGKQPLRMIVSGTAGTGKSYLIQCLKLLLGSHLRVTAPTGVAALKNHWQALTTSSLMKCQW